MNNSKNQYYKNILMKLCYHTQNVVNISHKVAKRYEHIESTYKDHACIAHTKLRFE